MNCLHEVSAQTVRPHELFSAAHSFLRVGPVGRQAGAPCTAGTKRTKS